jgi:protein TonB
MFEDSLVESRVSVISPEKRWTAVASIAVQATLAAVVIAFPFLNPETLPFRVDAPKVLMPMLPKPPVRVIETVREASGSTSSLTPAVASRPLIFTHTTQIEMATPDESMLAPIGVGMTASTGVPAGVGISDGKGPTISVAAPKPAAGPLRISSGLSEGMLIAPIRPVYPGIAKAARVEGTVVVEAVISKTGTVESLHVVSGPMMLQNAALEAIREARYRPYRLNGDAVEVQTTITVNFRIGG